MKGKDTSPGALPGDLNEAHRRIRELEGENSRLRARQVKLEERKRHFEALYERAPLGYQSLDEEGRILDVNQAWLDAMGYAREEVVGRWFGDFVDPLHQKQYQERFSCFKENGRISGVEFAMRTKGGQNIIASFEGRVGRDEQGRFSRTHCLMQNITQQRLLLQERAADKALLDMSQSVARTGGWQRDLDTNILFWTDEHYHLLGYKPGEVPPSVEVFMKHVLPEDRARVDAARAKALAGSSVYEVEYRFRREDGEVRHGYTKGRIFRDEDGTPTFMHGIMADVTERKLAEEKMRRSEERYRTIFESAPVGIYQTTPEGRIIAVNSTMCAYYGYADQKEMVDALEGHSLRLWADGADRDEFIAGLRDKGHMRDFELRGWRKDGSEFWLATTATLEHDPAWGGEVISGFCQDVTSHKAAREELRRHQTLLRHVQRISKVGGWEYDLERDEIFWTTEAYRIHGLPPSSSFRPADDFRRLGDGYYSPEDIKALETAHRRCFEEAEPFDFEVPMVTSRGEDKILRLAGRLVKNPSGEPKVVGTMMDITDLRQAEELHQTLFDSMLEACALHEIILDEQGRPSDYRFLAVNPAFERITGLPASRVLGRRVLEVLPETEAHWIRTYGEVALGGKPISFAMQSRELGKYFEVSAFQAAPGRFACIFQDVTERLRGEQALREAKDQAEAASKAKSQFLANMSHEIRTPLNGMLGLLQLLGTSSLDGAQKKYVDTAIESGWRLNGLVDDILDISRIEAGKVVLRIAPFDLRDAVGSAFRLFEPAARSKSIELKLHVADDIPQRVMGDAARLQQVLNNLVGNALKFTDSGAVALECYILPEMRPGKVRVLFSIADTGIGIADDKLDTLFDAFTQAESSYTRTYQGAGLGLYISQRLVKLMGGNMAVASEQGAGTTLHFCVPFGVVEQPVTGVVGTVGDAARTVRPLRVLLAEDDGDSQFFVSELLRREGHHVTVAANGEEALKALRGDDFDVVLMDIQMPVMNGLDATRAIRSSQEFASKARIPVIALTAYAMAGDREVFLKAGMDDYLAKPVSKENLLEVLDRNTTKRR